MNLFVCGWNVDVSRLADVLDAVRGMDEVYPQLDRDTLWSVSGEKILAAGMHVPAVVAAPRQYVYQTPAETAFLDGCLVDPTGRMRAMHAEDLSRNWPRVSESMEGQFAAVRVNTREPRLDVVNDVLGMGQVYYVRAGEGWWLSNSVLLIEKITGPKPLDALGVSLFLTVGWVGADRTLREGIRVLPAASSWTWSPGDAEPVRRCYYPARHLAELPRRRRFTTPDAQQLSRALETVCKVLGAQFAPLDCPITGGRDSRVLVALLKEAGVQAEYYTDGLPDSSDVRIGREIAEMLHLDHKVVAKTAGNLAEQWDELSRRIVLQNDGMVSLWQIADVADQPVRAERLPVSLWGIGGEIGRRFYAHPRWFIRGRDKGGAKELLLSTVWDSCNGLIPCDVAECSRTHLLSWVDRVFDEGFAPIDVPDVFYAAERIGRWASANARKALPKYDLFSPFCTRAYLEAAFSLSALYRYSEPLHYGLLKLHPDLHALGFEKEPWRLQWPGWNVLGAVWEKKVRPRFAGATGARALPAFDQVALLERKRMDLLDFILGQSASPVWEYIDERNLVGLLSDDDSAGRARHSGFIYQALTLLYYAAG